MHHTKKPRFPLPNGLMMLLIVLLAGLALTAGIAAAQGDPQTHTVGAGETLSSIAEEYGVTVEALAAANNITDPDLIFAGVELTIPEPGSGGGDTADSSAPAMTGSSAAAGTVVSYTVQPRDTIDTIAQALNVDPADIIAANFADGRNPRTIYPGEVLVIPVDAGPYPGVISSFVSAPAGATTVIDGQGGGGAAANQTYTVQRGDLLSLIAEEFDVSVESIAYANGLEAPYPIAVGQVLVIPGNGTPFGVVPPAPGEAGFAGEVSGSGGGDSAASSMTDDSSGISTGGPFDANVPGTDEVIDAEGGAGGADAVMEGEESSSSAAVGAGGGGETYTVQDGDTLLSIVFGLDIDLMDFLQANPQLLNGIQIEEGMAVNVP